MTTTVPTATPTTPSTADTVSEFFTRFGAGDISGLLDLFADTVDWNVAGSPAVPWTGRRSTKPEIQAFLEAATTLVQTQAFAVDQVLTDGATGVVLGRFSHTVIATGKTFTSTF